MITSHYVRYLVALASCVPLAMSTAQTTAWNDTGTNFNLAGSWSSGLPDVSTVAQFPVDGAIGFQPTLTSSISVLGLDFQGVGYTVGGTGTLTVGASGVTSAGSGTNTIGAALATVASSSQTWNIGTSSTLAVTGALTAGSGSTVVKTGAGTLTLNGTSGALATTLDIQGGVVKASTKYLASSFALSNAAELQIGFTGVTSNVNGTMTLGSGGGIISQVPASGNSTRLDFTFAGSGDLELRGNTTASRFMQLNQGSSLNASTNSGSTSITSGTVRLSGGYALGDSSIVSVNSGAELQIRNSETVGGLKGAGTVSAVAGSTGSVNNIFTLNSSTTNVFSGLLKDDPANSGNTLGITKNGAGVQTFSGANTYSGGTTVTAGTLLITNTSGSGTGTGAVTVNGGTFGGTGAASGNVTVATGAALQAGDGASASGALTLSGDVSLGTGSVIKLTLGDSGQHSTLARTGGVWAFASGQQFTLTSIGAGIGFYDDVITGLSSALDASLWTITNAGYVGTFSFDENNNVDLTIFAVPEPTTWAYLGMAFFACFALFFRRRKQSDL